MEIDYELYFALKKRGRELFNQLGEKEGWLHLIGLLMAYLDTVQAELKEEMKTENLLKN